MMLRTVAEATLKSPSIVRLITCAHGRCAGVRRAPPPPPGARLVSMPVVHLPRLPKLSGDRTVVGHLDLEVETRERRLSARTQRLQLPATVGILSTLRRRPTGGHASMGGQDAATPPERPCERSRPTLRRRSASAGAMDVARSSSSEVARAASPPHPRDLSLADRLGVGGTYAGFLVPVVALTSRAAGTTAPTAIRRTFAWQRTAYANRPSWHGLASSTAALATPGRNTAVWALSLTTRRRGRGRDRGGAGPMRRATSPLADRTARPTVRWNAVCRSPPRRWAWARRWSSCTAAPTPSRASAEPYGLATT